MILKEISEDKHNYSINTNLVGVFIYNIEGIIRLWKTKENE